jgi:hypothetical protein
MVQAVLEKWVHWRILEGLSTLEIPLTAAGQPSDAPSGAPSTAHLLVRAAPAGEVGTLEGLQENYLTTSPPSSDQAAHQALYLAARQKPAPSFGPSSVPTSAQAAFKTMNNH